LSPDDHVLDVGANIGIFSLLAANRVGADGMVYSIEPVAKNVQSLCAGIHANGFRNVSLFPIAASDRASVVAVLRQVDYSNGIVDYNVGVSDAVDFVPTQRLDFVLSGIPRLDVVKMDIEGHEPLAWRGLKSLIHKHRPRIFSEFSPIAIRNHCRVKAESYLDDLFEVASGHIEVLARDGRRIRCKDTLSVMQEWRDANREMGMNGELHCDLLIDTTR
jgi:FkbM family methyltransferase